MPDYPSLCYATAMRYMGIDFGTKKVGVALSDESGTMAFPETVLANDDNLLKSVVALAEDKAVKEIVIGHSLNTTGEPNRVQQAIEEFITDLTLHLGITVHLEPEQYTTQEALRLQGRSDKTDASAAAIILNSYLNRIK